MGKNARNSMSVDARNSISVKTTSINGFAVLCLVVDDLNVVVLPLRAALGQVRI